MTNLTSMAFATSKLLVIKAFLMPRRLCIPSLNISLISDLSILPSNVGANTYNTTLAIGEKAALFIAEELNIYGYPKAE